MAASLSSATSGRSSFPVRPCSGEKSAVSRTPAARMASMLRWPDAVQAGVIGDQADAFAGEFGELGGFHDVESGEHFMIGRAHAADARASSVS